MELFWKKGKKVDPPLNWNLMGVYFTFFKRYFWVTLDRQYPNLRSKSILKKLTRQIPWFVPMCIQCTLRYSSPLPIELQLIPPTSKSFGNNVSIFFKIFYIWHLLEKHILSFITLFVIFAMSASIYFIWRSLPRFSLLNYADWKL